MINITDEAERATCETCQRELDRDQGIECEGCGGWYCHECWKGPIHGKDPHFCGVLTDISGNLVKLGDIIKYPNTDREYTVVEILPSFTSNGICYAERRPIRQNIEKVRSIIRPRLMKIIS